MPLTAEDQATINNAWRTGLSTFNRTAAIKVADVQSNINALCKNLYARSIALQFWGDPDIWIVAITTIYADLQKVPTREELAHQREIGERKAGNQRYVTKDKNEGPKKTALDGAFEDLDNLFKGKSKKETPATPEAVVYPDVATFDPLNITVDQARLIKKLSGEQYRLFLSRVREHQLTVAQENTRPMIGNVRLKGDPK